MLCLAVLFIAISDAPVDWIYPNSVGQSGTAASNDEVITSSFSRLSDDGFATVIDWYSDRTNMASLKKSVTNYVNRKPGNSANHCGSANSMTLKKDAISNATANYFFTPNQMHAMIVFTDEDTGDVISISIAGNDEQTTINFVRQLSKDD